MEVYGKGPASAPMGGWMNEGSCVKKERKGKKGIERKRKSPKKGTER